MTHRRTCQAGLSAEQLLDELARQDEAEAEEGQTPSAAHSTLNFLKAELDTLAVQIREPVPVVPFEDESDCRRVTELVEALGLEPSQANAISRENETADSLIELGQYQLLAQLGQGGMGTVYKALHTKLDKIVALKVLPEQKTSDSHAVARFAREMRAVGRLEHANIVRAMDANEHEGKHYLVMEYIDGVDLSELVHHFGPLPIADACELVRQAAIGLQHAHEHGLVHRDIKPSNLMLTKAGQVKLLDLGLARLHAESLGELTTAGQMMGTIDYMAPEQTGDSHDVDIRADIYGLGATLFKLLTNRTPYSDERHDTMIKKLNALATRPVPSIRVHREDIPENLAAIVTMMLAKEAADRPVTPREVADALAPFAADCDLLTLVASYEEHRTADDETAKPSIGSTQQYLTAPMTETTSTKADEPDQNSLEATIIRQTQPAVCATGSAYAPHHDASVSAAQAQPVAHMTGNRIVATLVGLAAILVALTVIVIQTDKGNIKVVSYDPGIEVTIKRNGEPVDGFQVRQRDGATSYFSGDYEVEVKGGMPDGVSIANEKFTLTRGKDVLVEITRHQASDLTPIEPKPATIDSDRRAAEWIIEHGGQVAVSSAVGKFITSVPELPTDPFAVTFVLFPENEDLPVEVIDQLAQFKRLQYCSLARADQIPLERLCQTLGQLPQLKTFGFTIRSDNDLRHLAALRQVEEFRFIGGASVTCEGIVKHLGDHPNFKSLTLAGVTLADDDLRYLTQLAALTSLDLEATGISDAGVLHLKDMQLETLKLAGNPNVTSASMMPVGGMASLKYLYTGNTSVDDVDLQQLAGLTNLKQLWLGSTSITRAGLIALRKSLPNCSLYTSFGTFQPGERIPKE